MQASMEVLLKHSGSAIFIIDSCQKLGDFEHCWKFQIFFT